MNHEWYQARLMEWKDAELPEGEREQVLGHLKACPSCRARVERWKQTRQSLSELGKGFFQESPFVGRVMEKIQGASEKRPRLRRFFFRIPEWIYPELGLAAAAVTLFFAFSILQHPDVSLETLLLGWSPADLQWIDETASPSPDATLWNGEV